MNIRGFLVVLFFGCAALASSFYAQYSDKRWEFLQFFTVIFSFLGGYLFIKTRSIARDVDVLRNQLEVVRQHMGGLARHLRELREGDLSLARVGVERAIRPGDFISLSALVRDLADGMTELEEKFIDFEAKNQKGVISSSGVVSSSVSKKHEGAVQLDRAKANKSLAVPAAVPPYVHKEARNIRQLVTAAIAADRFDLYLQRVVALPQRRVRGYEISLRPEGCDPVMSNNDIRQAVEVIGHQLVFDRKLMMQVVQLARGFLQRGHDHLLFVDISPRFILNADAVRELSILVQDEPNIPKRIVLCLPQRFFERIIATDQQILDNFTNMGFLFLVREVENIEFDFKKVAQAGARWLRMPSSFFLDLMQKNETLFGVASSDLVPLLERHRLSLLVDNVDENEQVPELIDFNVTFTKGAAFALPRAVHSDTSEIDMANEREEANLVEEKPASGSDRKRLSLRELARRA